MTTWMICQKGCVTTEPEHFTGEHVCFREVNLSDSLTAISVAQFRAYAKKRVLEHRAAEHVRTYREPQQLRMTEDGNALIGVAFLVKWGLAALGIASVGFGAWLALGGAR